MTSRFWVPSSIKKIIHVDMDAFYTSVEQLDNPNLKGKPVAVGGDAQRGVVAAASYEARRFGVKSAMPSARAKKSCPELIFIRPRFERYKEISQGIRAIFFEYTDAVEPLSLDEAFLDITFTPQQLNSATLIAKEIKYKIKNTTGLTASAGISFNKFLAKTASDINKPDGLFAILPKEADDFTAKLPIRKFFGIGKKTAEKMKSAGIFRGQDLRKYSMEELTRRYGKSGKYYFNICRGIDNRPVQSNRERKSISVENTYSSNFMKIEDVHAALDKLRTALFQRYTGDKIGKTLTIKIKYGDFKQVTKSKTIDSGITNQNQVKTIYQEEISKEYLREEGIRLLGLGISNFKEIFVRPQQLTISF